MEHTVVPCVDLRRFAAEENSSTQVIQARVTVAERFANRADIVPFSVDEVSSGHCCWFLLGISRGIGDGVGFGRIHFEVHADVRIGQTVYVTGDGDSLGQWQVPNALRLVTSPERFPYWFSPSAIMVSDGATMRYKYVIFSGRRFERWENIDGSRVVVVAGPEMTIQDTLDQMPQQQQPDALVHASPPQLTVSRVGSNGAFDEPAEDGVPLPSPSPTPVDEDEDQQLPHGRRPSRRTRKLTTHERLERQELSGAGISLSAQGATPSSGPSQAAVAPPSLSLGHQRRQDKDRSRKHESGASSRRRQGHGGPHRDAHPPRHRRHRRGLSNRDSQEERKRSSSRPPDRGEIFRDPDVGGDTFNKEADMEVPLSASDSVIIVQHQLPVRVRRGVAGKWDVEWDDENLLSPKHGSLADQSNLRVAWVGIPVSEDPIAPEDEDALVEALGHFNCTPVLVEPEMYRLYYHGFCRDTLWPVFHNIVDVYGEVPTRWWNGDKQSQRWHAYMEVNRLFAEKVMQVYHSGDMVWVHDYHLLLAPSFVARRMRTAHIGLFFHTPFPSSEIFRSLSVRDELLRGVLNADHVGFHLYEYARHFITACRRILGLSHRNRPRAQLSVEYQGRDVVISVCHAGLEPSHVLQAARSKGVSAAKNAYRLHFVEGCVVPEEGSEEMQQYLLALQGPAESGKRDPSEEKNKKGATKKKKKSNDNSKETGKAAREGKPDPHHSEEDPATVSDSVPHDDVVVDVALARDGAESHAPASPSALDVHRRSHGIVATFPAQSLLEQYRKNPYDSRNLCGALLHLCRASDRARGLASLPLQGGAGDAAGGGNTGGTVLVSPTPSHTVGSETSGALGGDVLSAAGAPVVAHDTTRAPADASSHPLLRTIPPGGGENGVRPARKLIVAIDNLVQLGGIPMKLMVLEQFLRRMPSMCDKIVLLQVVVHDPTRPEDTAATAYTVRSLVARLNQRFAPPGSSKRPIVFLLERSHPVPLWDRVALWSAADVYFSTSLRDGISLFPMEFVTICATPPGVLLLSEFSSASRVVNGALRVNPWRMDEVGAALEVALTMPREEAQSRRDTNMGFIKRVTTSRWAEHVLTDLKRAARLASDRKYMGYGLGLYFRVLGFGLEFRPLNTEHVLAAYRCASRRLILLDYGGTMNSQAVTSSGTLQTSSALSPTGVQSPSNALPAGTWAEVVAAGIAGAGLDSPSALRLHRRDRAAPLTTETQAALSALSADPRNTVVILSGKERSVLAEALKDLPQVTIVAEHGFYYRWGAGSGPDQEWHRLIEHYDESWKDVARRIMDVFAARTNGTFVMTKGCALAWFFGDADAEFGHMQARDLMDHLNNVLRTFSVEVVLSSDSVEVRPKGVNKGVITRFLLDQLEGRSTGLGGVGEGTRDDQYVAAPRWSPDSGGKAKSTDGATNGVERSTLSRPDSPDNGQTKDSGDRDGASDWQGEWPVERPEETDGAGLDPWHKGGSADEWATEDDRSPAVTAVSSIRKDYSGFRMTQSGSETQMGHLAGAGRRRAGHLGEPKAEEWRPEEGPGSDGEVMRSNRPRAVTGGGAGETGAGAGASSGRPGGDAVPAASCHGVSFPTSLSTPTLTRSPLAGSRSGAARHRSQEVSPGREQQEQEEREAGEGEGDGQESKQPRLTTAPSQKATCSSSVQSATGSDSLLRTPQSDDAARVRGAHRHSIAPVDFILAIGNDTSDEPMFRALTDRLETLRKFGAVEDAAQDSEGGSTLPSQMDGSLAAQPHALEGSRLLQSSGGGGVHDAGQPPLVTDGARDRRSRRHLASSHRTDSTSARGFDENSDFAFGDELEQRAADVNDITTDPAEGDIGGDGNGDGREYLGVADQQTGGSDHILDAPRSERRRQRRRSRRSRRGMRGTHELARVQQFTVTVGKKPSAAQYFVDDTQQVEDLLSAMTRASVKTSRNWSMGDLRPMQFVVRGPEGESSLALEQFAIPEQDETSAGLGGVEPGMMSSGGPGVASGEEDASSTMQQEYTGWGVPSGPWDPPSESVRSGVAAGLAALPQLGSTTGLHLQSGSLSGGAPSEPESLGSSHGGGGGGGQQQAVFAPVGPVYGLPDPSWQSPSHSATGGSLGGHEETHTGWGRAQASYSSPALGPSGGSHIHFVSSGAATAAAHTVATSDGGVWAYFPGPGGHVSAPPVPHGAPLVYAPISQQGGVPSYGVQGTAMGHSTAVTHAPQMQTVTAAVPHAWAPPAFTRGHASDPGTAQGPIATAAGGHAPVTAAPVGYWIPMAPLATEARVPAPEPAPAPARADPTSSNWTLSAGISNWMQTRTYTSATNAPPATASQSRPLPPRTGGGGGGGMVLSASLPSLPTAGRGAVPWTSGLATGTQQEDSRAPASQRALPRHMSGNLNEFLDRIDEAEDAPSF